MLEIKNPIIKLKGKLDENDARDIKSLEKFCMESEEIALKLEIDYKISDAKNGSENLNNINEFMYYDNNKLIGYIGICEFGRNILEVNGMVHPEYRRIGIFKKLFSLVKDEGHRREAPKMLLLSDNNSIAGLGFIKSTCANHDHSEYEMFLKSNGKDVLKQNNVILRKATNKDAKEITIQDSIYFNIEFNEEDISMPEEKEMCGMIIYVAEVNNKIIGKINLEIRDDIGGIYGLGVLPEYRKKGYGREILISGIGKLKEKNPKEIMLQVETKNECALSLYKSCGFEVTSIMDYYKI